MMAHEPQSVGQGHLCDAQTGERCEAMPARNPVFLDATLTLSDFQRIRAVITDVDANVLQVRFSARLDLPFRVKIGCAILRLNCWARVARQDDGWAQIELLR